MNLTDVTVVKLTPSLVDDYVAFFDNTAHNASSNHDKCYCIAFCNDDVYHTGGVNWYDASDQRRAHAIQRVRDGNIQGYLAYHNGNVIGWCNANTKSDCGAVMDYMRSYNIPVADDPPERKVKFIFCFTVAPTMQGKGVATKMLEFICQDAAAEGFDAIEAKSSRVLSSDGFFGPLALYLKNGFTIHAEQGERLIVHKDLYGMKKSHG